MKKFNNHTCFVVISTILLSSCIGQKAYQEPKPIVVENLVFMPEAELAKGRVDVYDAMGRAVKYNTVPAAKNLSKELNAHKINPQVDGIVKSIENIKTQEQSSLYTSARLLEFAVIFSTSVLESENSLFLDNYYYSKTAEYLSLMAIKSHYNAMNAKKKIRDIDRLISREQKKLDLINAKNERNGILSDDDLAYKKALDVSIYKMNEANKALSMDLDAYIKLIKADKDAVKIEGRRFYELEDFDKDHTLGEFINSAFRNRQELLVARKSGYNYSFDDIDAKSVSLYPEMELLRVNGYDYNDPIYAVNLEKRANEIAKNLIEDTVSYINETNVSKKHVLENIIYDNLGIAVFAQNEVAFNLVKFADIQYAITLEKIKQTQSQIIIIDRTSRISVDKKEELLVKNLELLNLEIKLDRIKSKRAVALKSLYFYAGFQPFNQGMVGLDVKDIVKSLKYSFNHNMVEILAARPNKVNKKQMLVNDWAKQDNWLENLLDNKNKTAHTEVNVDFSLYKGEKYNKLKIMQLGSYFEENNADKEWNVLLRKFSEFKNLKPVVEETRVSGVKMYRLIVKSKTGGFMKFCNKLRRNNVECLLK